MVNVNAFSLFSAALLVFRYVCMLLYVIRMLNVSFVRHSTGLQRLFWSLLPFPAGFSVYIEHILRVELYFSWY